MAVAGHGKLERRRAAEARRVTEALGRRRVAAIAFTAGDHSFQEARKPPGRKRDRSLQPPPKHGCDLYQ